MSSFTACDITGSVMMNMINNTNITSMSGVVLISIIGSPSPPPPTCIAMVCYLYRWRLRLLDRLARLARQRDEADLHDALALRIDDDAADVLVTRLAIGADVHFGLRLHPRGRFQTREQIVVV